MCSGEMLDQLMRRWRADFRHLNLDKIRGDSLGAPSIPCVASLPGLEPGAYCLEVIEDGSRI